MVSGFFSSSQILEAVQEMEINTHSRQNKRFPSCISAPLGREEHRPLETHTSPHPAQSLKLPGHTQMTRRSLKSLAEEWEEVVSQTHGRSRKLCPRPPHPPLDARASPPSLYNPLTNSSAAGPPGHPNRNPSEINNIACHPYRVTPQHRARDAAVSVGVALAFSARGSPLPTRPLHGRTSLAARFPGAGQEGRPRPGGVRCTGG